MTKEERGRGFARVREFLGETQESLATKFEVSLRSLQNWEAGMRPRQNTAEKYLEALKRQAVLPDDADFTIDEILDRLMDPAGDFSAWCATFDRLWRPPAVLRQLLRFASVEDDRATVKAGTHARVLPTTQQVVLAGPGGQKLRLRVEKDGTIDLQMSSGWTVEQIGAQKLDLQTADQEAEEAPTFKDTPLNREYLKKLEQRIQELEKVRGEK